MGQTDGQTYGWQHCFKFSEEEDERCAMDSNIDILRWLDIDDSFCFVVRITLNTFTSLLIHSSTKSQMRRVTLSAVSHCFVRFSRD